MDEEERKKEITEVLHITVVVVCAGAGLLLATWVIPWLKGQFAGSLAAAVVISAIGVAAYFLADKLFPERSMRFHARIARYILLGAVLFGAWLG